MAPGVCINFAGEIYQLSADEQLLFGRGKGADLNVDSSNKDLHRRFGRIWFSNGVWWLSNEGRLLPMSVHDRNSISSFTLAAGNVVSLTFKEAAIRFTAGATNYEILLDLAGSPGEIDQDVSDSFTDELSPATVDQAQIPVVGGQRLLLVALAEQKLRNPHEPIVLPSNKAIYRRLGWTSAGFNRKLDRLCHKFARAGVKGLVGDLGDHAAERRRKLVEHTVKLGVITASDLSLLEDYPETL